MNEKNKFFERLMIFSVVLVMCLSTLAILPTSIADDENDFDIVPTMKETIPDYSMFKGSLDIDVAMTGAAEYLVHAQADITEDNAGNGDPDNPDDPDDGGWDWRLTSPAFTHSTSASSTNLYGATALGLYYAYLETSDASYKTALDDAAGYMITDSEIDSGSDLVFLMLYDDLPDVSGTTYQDSAKTKYDAKISTQGNATAWVEYIRDARAGQGYENGIIPWDIGIWVKAAAMLHDRYSADGYDSDADDMAEVIYQDSFMQNPGYFNLTTNKNKGWDPNYGNTDYYWYSLGITGLIDSFVTADVHTDKIASLLTTLLECQYPSGAFSYCYGANTYDEDWQSTAYAVNSLALVNKSTYQTEINHACYWLAATQDSSSGGWVYSSGNHYPEVGGECISALFFEEEILEVTQPVQVTTNESYQRGQSIVYDGSKYWMFFGQSEGCSDPYSIDNPDVNDYVLCYKKASSIAGLTSGSKDDVELPVDDVYLGETGCAYIGGKIWTFVTIDVGSTCSLYGYYTSDDGDSWTEVGPYISDMSDGQAHHDEVVFDGELWILEGSGDYHTMHSSTPTDDTSFSIPLQVGASESLTGGLGHFFVDASNLYLALGSGGSYYIYWYNDTGVSWDLVASKTISGYYDPSLFKVDDNYVFAAAPYAGGRQWIVGWTSTSLDSGFFDGRELSITEGRYNPNVWVDMWPIGYTDANNDTYLFFTSERNPDDKYAEIAGNIWYLKYDWDPFNDHYTYIQEAIDAASGTTIKIHDGLYIESNILVNKSATIIGLSRENVVVAPDAEDIGSGTSSFDGSYQHGFMVVADDVTIKNLTIDGTANNIANGGLLPNHNNYRIGVLNYANGDDGYNNLTIEDVNIHHIRRRGVALWPYTTYGHLVAGCDVKDVDYHQGIMSAAPVTITENTIYETGEAIGLFPGFTAHSMATFHVSNNTIYDCASTWSDYYGTNWPVVAIYYRNPNYDQTVIITGNNITIGDGDEPTGFPGVTGMYIYNADENSLIGNNVIDSTSGNSNWGIYLGGCAGATVSNNDFIMNDNDTGMYLGRGIGGTPVPNMITGNTFTSTGSFSNELSDGCAIVQGDHGDLFWMVENPYDTNNIITENDFSGFDTGILLHSQGLYAVDVTINDNNFYGTNIAIDASTLSAIIDAECNWYGDASGPSGYGPGSGDNVSSNVDFVPWLDDAYPLGDCVGDCADSLYVDDDAASIWYDWNHVATIQTGIDRVCEGGTIYVAAGTYAGAIVNKTVTISGSTTGDSNISSGVPYKSGSGLQTAFRLDVGSDGTEITDFTINCDDSSNFYFAVFSRSVDDVVIDSFEVNDAVQGISNYDGNNWEITNNVLTDTVASGGGGIGIMFGVRPPQDECSGNLVQNNIIHADGTEAGYTAPGICLALDTRYGAYDDLTGSEELTNNEIINNTIMGTGNANEVGIEVGVIGVSGNSTKVAYTMGMIHDNLIQNNTVDGSDYGIYAYVAEDLAIEENEVKNCITHGISIWDDFTGNINYNNIFGNGNYGLWNNLTTTVDATCNWWGDIAGPSGEGPGNGDNVSTNVDYCPWLDDEYPDGDCVGGTCADPVWVDDDASSGWYDWDHVAMIQTALDRVCVGGTVYVAAGDYIENILVDKSVNLIGDGRDTTIVHNSGDINQVYTMKIDGNQPGLTGDVVVEGLTFTGNYGWNATVTTDHIPSGITLTFQNNRINDSYLYGWWDYHSHGNLEMHNNIVSNVEYGLMFEGWDTGTINIGNNDFQLTPGYFGYPAGMFHFTYSYLNCTNPYNIYENTFSTSAPGYGVVFYGGYGSGLDAAQYTDVTIVDNEFNAIGYYGVYLRNYGPADQNDIGGVHNALIAYNNFTDCSRAVLVYDNNSDIIVNYNNFIDTPYLDILDIKEDEISEYTGPLSHVSFPEVNTFDITDYGIQNTGIYEVDGTCNWWGDVTGPYHSTLNPTGLGCNVSDTVAFMPWLDDVYPDGDCNGGTIVHNINSDEWFLTIQEAIDDTDTINGDTLEIIATTHAEGPQIVISKDLTITGQGCSSTIIIPTANTGSGGDARGWWLVNDGIELQLSNLKLDGYGFDIYQGIRHKGDGTIDQVCFQEIKYPGYGGVAVAAFGGGPVDITNCQFSEIGRVGVLYWVTNSLFEGNTYVGKGDGDWLDYCLDIGGGGGVTVIDNTISGCTGVASSDGSESAGILVTTLYAPGTYATIEENDISDCTMAIAVGYDSSDTSSVSANYNNFFNCEWGITSTAPLVDGTCNWWGDILGPYHSDDNPMGIGCNVSDNVTFIPWLDDEYPYGDCNGYPGMLTADFDYNPNNPSAYETVTFTDQSTVTGATIVNWSWTFGDGDNSYLQNPTHQYTADGKYPVILTVTDDLGHTDTISKLVPVGPIQLASLVGNYWNILSLPFNESVNKNDMLVKYDNAFYSWSQAVSQGLIINFIYGWDESIQSYQFASTLEPGQGYWVFAYVDCELWVDEVTTPSDTLITDVGTYWNLIGLPFDQSVNKLDVIVRYDNIDHTWNEAVTDGVVVNFVYGWNAAIQSYQFANTFIPGYGYWLFAYQPCRLKQTI